MSIRCIVVTLALATASCGSARRAPDTATITLAPIAPPASAAPPTDPPETVLSESGLRVAMENEAVLYSDGHRLAIGQSETHAREVLGSPTWTQDNPVDQTAMSDTTYLFYSDRGLAVRIKHKKVEGFYVSLEATNIDGHPAVPAHPVLPRGLPVDATVEEVAAKLGEPTSRDPFALMDWLDLHYRIGNVVVEYHYEHLKLVSVDIELGTLKK